MNRENFCHDLVVFSLLACLVFATKVIAADDNYGEPDKPLVAEVLGTQVHTDDVEEMQYVILDRLLDDYAKQQRITVTTEEIDAYIETVQQGLAAERRDVRKQLDDIAAQLQQTGLESSQREQLLAEQQSLRGHLENLTDTEDADPAAAAEVRRARETVARSFIKYWKINRALYRQYGGRVIFQQVGPEPLDAYRTLLETRQAQGDFKIFDTDYESRFWRYFTDDSRHSFYPETGPDAQRAIETPWWQEQQPQ